MFAAIAFPDTCNYDLDAIVSGTFKIISGGNKT